MKVKGGPELWGVVEYAKSWDELPEEERPYGVYSFLMSQPTDQTKKFHLGINTPNGGGVYVGDEFRFVNFGIMYDTQVVTYYYRYDINTWEQIGYPQFGMDAGCIATDLTFDQTTGNVYGYFYNPLDMEANMNFGTITYGDYGVSVNKIAEEQATVIGLTTDTEGVLYALTSDGGFHKVDKTTGAKTLVDYTGVPSSTFRQSMAYDAKSGKIYWTAFIQADQDEFISELYEINPADAVTKKIAVLDDSQEITCLYIPAPAADDNAPAAPSGLALDFKGGDLSGTVSFTLPSETYGGDVLSGSLSYEVFANGKSVASGNAGAGTEVKAIVDVPEGMTEFHVVASNAAGAGAGSEKVNRFIGFDTPGMPVGLAIDFDRSTGKVSLEWEAPESTLYGGYLDEPNLRYDVVRYPGGVKVADKTFLNMFSETVSCDELASYYYTVCAVNHDKTGEAAGTEKVTVGEAFNVPFDDDFSTQDYYGLYDVADVAGDDVTWKEAMNSFSIFYHWTNPLDDWLFTPPVRLDAGVTYSFTVGLRGGSSYDEESFEIGFGNGVDPASYSIVLEETKVKSSNYSDYRCSVTPERSGIYRFGIHATSQPYRGGMYVNHISVDTEYTGGSPELVGNLQIKAGENGLPEATLSFNAPDKTRDGDELTSISRIEISREGKVINTMESPAPGSKQSFTEKDIPDGTAVYRIVAYNEAGKGAIAETSIYVGMDIPDAVTGLKLSDTGNNRLALSWDAVDATGIHEGFVDTRNVVYTIYAPDGTEIDKVTGSTSWNDPQTLTDGQPGLAYYKVAASTSAGESEPCESNYMAIGTPATLPVKESFANSTTAGGLWWAYGKMPFNAFGFSTESSDHDGGSMRWYAVEDDDWSYFASGRIAAKGSARAILFFDYKYNPGTQMKFKVCADPGQKGDVTLATFDAMSDTDSDTDWRRAVVEIPSEIAESDYFVLRFHAEGDRFLLPGYEPNALLIDNIELRDVPDNDVAVRLESPAYATGGETITTRVYIDNLGFNPVTDLTVELIADGETVDSRDIDIPFDSSAEVLLDFTAPVNKSREVTLVSRAELSGDAAAADNSDEITITVADPFMPKVNDLKAEGEDIVTLTWNAPEDLRRHITETFDSYTPWDYENAGGWSMYDGDGVETNVYTGMHYPNIGKKLAWIVFNKDHAGMFASQEEIFTPLSGNQCMLAVATLHEYGKGIECEDWLITPRLSGDEQGIEFDIKSLTDYEEDFAVYITSAESADVSELRGGRLAFEKFGVGNQWRHYKYTLPAGTTYAALVYTSNLSGVMVDNFVYDAPALPVKGYVIYRNGEKIASVGAGWKSFVDTDATDNKGVYAVSVLYEDGESGLSNEARVDLSGIDDVSRLDEDSRIYAVDGIYLGKGREAFEKLPAGIYMIGGKKTVKRRN